MHRTAVVRTTSEGKSIMQRRSIFGQATRTVAGAFALAGAGTLVTGAGASAQTVSSAKPLAPTATATTGAIAGRSINLTTAWIDASAVYGIDSPSGLAGPRQTVATPASLREGGAVASTGRMITSEGKNLPVANGLVLAGDPRAAENPDLAAIHTLWVREHNWHVERLAKVHPQWTGDQLYRQARAIVTAEIQQVTYREFLPTLLGPGAIPQWNGYRSNVDPTISVEFSVAAMRFGHSIVSNVVSREAEDGSLTGPEMLLRDAFFMPASEFVKHGGADGFLRHIGSDVSNTLDAHLVDDLRNFLNDPPVAIDLAAINIQRSRDVGLGTLNQTRVALGMRPHADFSQVTPDPELASRLKTAYGTIDRLDLWIGGLSERRVRGALVGETFHRILTDQFVRLRDGDRLWWENQSWDRGMAQWIRETTIADVVLRNTDTRRMQANMFLAAERADLGRPGVALAVARTDPHRASGAPIASNEVRSHDGTGTNTQFTALNGVGWQFGRIGPARFADSVHTMVTGDPNPRTISNVVVAYENTSIPAEKASAMLYVWGQFLTHEIEFAKSGTEDGSVFSPAGDPVLATGTMIPMTRLAVDTSTPPAVPGGASRPMTPPPGGNPGPASGANPPPRR